MPYVIGAECIDELDESCVDVCPVDCIYEGARKRYINPDECIECGACVPVCPVDAITDQPPGATDQWAADNERFFLDVLTGRAEPLGTSPGGASAFGRIGADTPMASAAPTKPTPPE